MRWLIAVVEIEICCFEHFLKTYQKSWLECRCQGEGVFYRDSHKEGTTTSSCAKELIKKFELVNTSGYSG